MTTISAARGGRRHAEDGGGVGGSERAGRDNRQGLGTRRYFREGGVANAPETDGSGGHGGGGMVYRCGCPQSTLIVVEISKFRVRQRHIASSASLSRRAPALPHLYCVARQDNIMVVEKTDGSSTAPYCLLRFPFQQEYREESAVEA